MKNALLVGCGNTRGEKIVSGCQDAGYTVTNIGQAQSKNDKVNKILHKKNGPVLLLDRFLNRLFPP